MKRPPGNKRVPVDGIMRSADREEQINGAFRTVFKGPAGELVLDYLRSITIEMVLGPDVSHDALRHREGMRQLFQIIEHRRTSEPRKM